MAGLTGKPYSTVHYGERQGIEGVVVNLRGHGIPAQEGNLRVRRLSGDIVVDVFRDNGWREAHSYREPTDGKD